MKMKKLNVSLFLAWSSVLLAALLHVIKFDKIPFQFDELLMFQLLQRYSYLEMIPHLYLKEIQQPLMYVVVKIFGDLFGYTSFILRLPSLILALALPMVTYLYGRMSLSKVSSLQASAIVLFSYPVMFFSSSMRPYLPLLFFAALTLLSMKAQKPRTSILLCSLLLFFVSPAGSIVSLCLVGWYLYRLGPGGKKALLFFIPLVLALILTYFQTRSSDFTYILSRPVGVDGLLHYGKSLFFLTSGKEGALAFLIVILLAAFKTRGFYFLGKGQVQGLILSVAIGCAIFSFSNNQLGARHLIMLVLPLAMIVARSIEVLSSSVLRNILFLGLVSVLVLKTFYLEKIHAVPWEIDSESIARKAQELGQGGRPILNCGNCLTYYITDAELTCFERSVQEEGLRKFKEEIVYVELDYVLEGCGIQRLNHRFDVKEKYDFIGGRVYLLAPRF